MASSRQGRHHHHQPSAINRLWESGVVRWDEHDQLVVTDEEVQP